MTSTLEYEQRYHLTSLAEAKKQAKAEQNRLLSKVMSMCNEGERNKVIPWLLAQMRTNQNVRTIRLWQLDALMFGVKRYTAVNTVRKALNVAQDDRRSPKAGFVTVGWALASQEHSIVMTAWLFTMLQREHLADVTVPDNFPYALLYKREGEEQ